MKKKGIEYLNLMERIEERDIDMLLIEELMVSSDFGKWFVKAVAGRKIKEFRAVKHSISNSKGESDIVFIFRVGSGKKYALLIENKISALAQPKQPQRYKERGELGKKQGDWDEYRTGIIAPKRYLETHKETEEYDFQISYEKVYGWFSKNKSARYRYKSEIINQAIEHNKRGYVQPKDKKTDKFWNDYYKYVSNKYPQFEMKKPSFAARQSWVHFCPRTLKKKIIITNKLSYDILPRDKEVSGVVDLQFNGYGKKVNKLEKKLKTFLKKNMTLEPTAKSASLRIRVPRVDVTLNFNSQIKKVEGGLKAAKKLMKIGVAVVDQI